MPELRAEHVDVDLAKLFLAGKALEPDGFIVDADEHPLGIHNPDRDREAAQNGAQLRFLEPGRDPSILNGALPLLDLGQRLLGLRPAIVLKLANGFGRGFINDVVDGLVCCFEHRDIPAMLKGKGGRRPHQRIAERAELIHELSDVVPLPPTNFAVLPTLDRRIRSTPSKPLCQPVEQLRDVIDELGIGKPLDFGTDAHTFDSLTPDGQNRVALLIEVIRQHGGLAHDYPFFATTALPPQAKGRARSTMLPTNGTWTQCLTGRATCSVSMGFPQEGCQATRHPV